MPQDYPDGMTRMLPGHTIDLENGFARPWYEGSSVTIAAGATGSYTLDFSDDDGIYYIDVVNVSPSAYKEFTVIIYINDAPYVCGSVMGFFFFNLRLNPSLLFITGDSVKVEILNLDSSQRTFSVKLNGTKVTRPVGFGKCPGAYFTASPLAGFAPLSVTFADGSSYSPTSWEWKVNGSDIDSTEQNPVIVVTKTGLVSPYLKASNQYGYDSYARVDYISVADPFPLSSFTEVDPNSHISGLAYPITVTNIICNENAYVAKDYGVDYFDGYRMLVSAKMTSADTNGQLTCVCLSSALPPVASGSGYNIVVNFFKSGSSTYQMLLKLQNGATDVVIDTGSISVNTPYYMILYHVAGSTKCTLYIYSDAAFTTLVDTLVITNAAVATKFRYLSAAASHNAGTTYKASGVIYNAGIVSL